MNKRIFFLALIFALFTIPAMADIIILKSGGKIYSAEWWYEGDELKYIGYGGIYGIAKSEITDIIPSVPIRDELNNVPEPESSPLINKTSPSVQIRQLEETAETLAKMAKERPGEEKELELQAAKVYTRIGNILFDIRSYEKAIFYYRKAIVQCPSFLAPKINISSTYMAAGNTIDALPYTLETLSEYPEEPALHQILGDIYYLMDQIDEAIYEWEEAVRIKPNDNISKKIKKAKKELLVFRNFHTENAAHFTLKFDGEKHPAIGDDIISFLEDSFDELVYKFNHYPPFTTTVILYPDKAFYAITEAPKWVGGLYDGKIRIPIKGLTHLTKISNNILRHELAHAFIFSKTNGNCPAWFHEGIAQIIEGKAAPSRKSIKKQIAIVDSKWLMENINYPIALSLTIFMEDRYSFFSINMILDELGRGKSFGEALRSTIGLDIAELIKEWKESLSME